MKGFILAKSGAVWGSEIICTAMDSNTLINIKRKRITMIMCYYTLNIKGIHESILIPKARTGMEGVALIYRIIENINEEGREFFKNHSVNLKVII